MYRFKTSKYKNSVSKALKKEECITNVTIGSPPSNGNLIKASAAFVAFSTESRGGGSLGILPIDFKGPCKELPMIHCHADFVTDFHFSPFDDGLLATGSQDSMLKFWHIPKDGIRTSLSTPEIVLSENSRIDNILFHPTADLLIATSASTSLNLWDIMKEIQVYSYREHSDMIQSIDWHGNGSLIATCCRDKKLRILDPRGISIAQETSSHSNSKDSRIVWLGSSDKILTTGFASSLQRQVFLHDVRNFSHPLKTLLFDTSSGILMPFFDCDTNMLFFAGKNDTSISFMELVERDPFIVEASKHICEYPTKGACLIPKRAVNVMEGEVNRLLQLTSNSIVPIMYQVPRKSYRDFHSDLFPLTKSAESALTAEEWLIGVSKNANKVSLNPADRNLSTLQKHRESLVILRQLKETTNLDKNEEKSDAPTFLKSTKNDSMEKIQPSIPEKTVKQISESSERIKPEIAMKPVQKVDESVEKIKPCVSEKIDKINENSKSTDHSQLRIDNTKESSSPVPKNKFSSKTFAGFRTSKFRHLKGTPLHRSHFIENIRNLSTSLPGESDGFQINPERVAIHLKGPGGQIAVLELNKPGRLPDGVLPVLQNGVNIVDFCWDPFDNRRIAVACDSGIIKIWKIPEKGLTQSLEEPEFELRGHSEKLYFIKFHPLANDILVSSSYDMSIRVWNLNTQETAIVLSGHTDQIFSLSWSPDGKQFATVCKDNKIRIYEPRVSTLPIKEGQGPLGSRGARIIWVLEGSYLVVCGFDRVSERQISVYDPNLKAPLTVVSIDVSPAILIPHYDEDSCTLFVTGKGDSTIYAYEVLDKTPYLYPLSHHKCPNNHQAVAFLPKLVCNIKDVEFARALRLTSSLIEPLSFTVPRIKMDFFQDDLFPKTRVLWKPTMSAQEWLSGENKEASLLCLQPEGMAALSENNATTNANLNAQLAESALHKTDKQKEQELVKAVSGKMHINKSLPQDDMEGVDPTEWDD